MSRTLQWLCTALGLLIATGFTAAVVACVYLVLFAAIFLPAIPLGLLSLFVPPLEPVADFAFLILGFITSIFASPRVVLAGSFAFACVAWLLCRRVWLDAGAAPLLDQLAARPVRRSDLGELQFENVVEEMATAAGVAPPRTMIVDEPSPNAALLTGSHTGDDALVVSHGLLEILDRDETQGVAAHLVASVVNGDSRLIGTLTSMFYIPRLLSALVLLPLMERPYAILRAFARALAASARGRPECGATAAAAVRLLMNEPVLERITGSSGAADDIDTRRFNRFGRQLIRAVPPMISLILLLQLALAFMEMVAGVPAALIWRRRRLLADATAVQLTRNASGLARALVHLSGAAELFPGGHRLGHLFIAPDRRQALSPSPESFEASHGVLVSMHPPLSRRLQLLERMGAISLSAAQP